MLFSLLMIFLILALFAGMAGLYAAGHGLALRREKLGMSREADGLTGAALFALFGLLLAFSLSGSIGRLEARRQLIVNEVNAIGTAYLRLDLLPAESREALRADFRAYCTVRRDAYVTLPTAEARASTDQQTAELQQRIWQRSLAASADEQFLPARILLVPALNQMIDITAARWIAARTHVPLIVIAAIFVVGLFCAWLAGYSIREVKKFGMVNMLSLAGVTALIIYVMLEIEFPRLGLVNLDDYNAMFDVLAQSMR